MTGHFLKDADRWTTDAAKAFDFKTIPAATEYARIHLHEALGVVLKSTDAQYDLELPNCC